MENYSENIGRKCKKRPIRTSWNNNINRKPFKSGLKVNTIKGVIEHPILKIPAYTFEEDDSYVGCRRCEVISLEDLESELQNNVDIKSREDLEDKLRKILNNK